ncbi:hypothetical protein DENSPDRAFT_877479 [Dentipellis sp. KUC8613]|nr:hypothetical protein DENSPDRAFT_877479 [Dentipellis sp. KUC8613]
MFATLFTVTLLSAGAIKGALAGLAINSPTLVQCEDAHVSWASTKGPYNLIVTPGDEPCGDAIVDLGDHDGTTMTYNVALPAGQKVLLSLQDANGDEAWSQELTVQPGSNSACLPASLQPSSSIATLSAASSSVKFASSSAPFSLSSTVVPLTAVTPATTISALALPSDSAAAAPSDTIGGDDSDAPSVVGGAANAASNPFSGAPAMHQLYTPAMFLSALGAAFFVAL